MMNNLERIVETASEMGAARVLVALGLTAGEISQRKARSIYGKWFTDAEKAGRIRPSRIDDGRNGTRHYRVADITVSQDGGPRACGTPDENTQQHVI